MIRKTILGGGDPIGDRLAQISAIHGAGSTPSSRAADYPSGDKDGLHLRGATGHC
jgi:hypothetical protein